MDLQLLASEIVNTNNVYDPIESLCEAINSVKSVTTESDIDALTNVLAEASYLKDISFPNTVNVNKITSMANVMKPYLDYSKTGEFFV
jgi:hypothetical protein